MKKDLVFARLSKFDNHPESYLAWKESFKSVMREIGITSSEELDLLVQYLGPQSHEHAVSIKASNASDHSKGFFPYTDSSSVQEKYQIVTIS